MQKKQMITVLKRTITIRWFYSVTLDKCCRNLLKYRIEKLSTKQKSELISKFLYCCIAFLLLTLIIILLCIHFEYIYLLQDGQVVIYKDDLLLLYSKFLKQLNVSRNNPKQTSNDKLIIPENNLFTRTKVIQYLYDYTIDATKVLYHDKYSSNPNYHHINCITPFSDEEYKKCNLTKLENAVTDFIAINNSLYTNHVLLQYAQPMIITNITSDGLIDLEGQYGLVSMRYIPVNTCLAHFYGDEYLREEFDAKFPHNIFQKKRKYYMSTAYNSFAYAGLSINENISLIYDAYFDTFESDKQSELKVIYAALVNDARTSMSKPNLTEHDLNRKNTEFVHCSVDGIIWTFLITTKDIKPQQQLFTYYGSSYTL
eukprot:2512_1